MINNRQQSGAVLIVGLVILLVLTMLGVTAVQTTVQEERMAGNLRNATLAFQAAESGLRAGEDWVMEIDPYAMPDDVTSCAAPPCDLWALGEFTSDFTGLTASDWATDAREYGDASQQFDSNHADPRYVVEYIGQPKLGAQIEFENRSKGLGEHYFRVTARGVGGDTQSQSIIQSTVRIEK